MTINGIQVQNRLNARGAGLKVDGSIGPRTYAALLEWVGQRKLGDKGLALGEGMARYLGPAGITTPLRLPHWLGQGSHETQGFTLLREAWGPTEAQKRYEGRADLGNTQPGDGFRYRGRGIFQTTGRGNYEDLATRIKIDVVAHPELLEEPHNAVLSACDYWTVNKLAQWADADDTLAMSRAINLGNPRSTRTPNGLAERQVATARGRIILI
ncbi:glycoside hydrolase family 19 protein [Sphingomonas sp. H39-1-10]|uniref:glycoside hydrolase family 19 protein n=1 Tax=Sphingomonas pollutisoli TaxID=3030829 RepID=UPI0023B9FF7B|nr:glycoside hydrolase family 19 protein [Sphingomonas pollutisoli]MDF0490042.1 glycoside hydrolase family 19 protein [Sphingomonas pollutisoli]